MAKRQAKAPVEGRIPLMAGNWKMNLNHQEAVVLVQKLAWTLSDKRHDRTRAEVAVFPPYVDIRSVQTLIDGDDLPIAFGAQNVSVHESGAYTGEVSASMLAKLGCSYVIVGHSERREHYGETDEWVALKAQVAHRHGIIPIVCVGEGLAVRREGTHVAFTTDQVKRSLEGLTAEQVAQSVIAYEPVWAIGTGETATPLDAEEVCAGIRNQIDRTYGGAAAESIRILYGGSVKAGNVAALMQQPDVDGALVGGASLDVEEFSAICRYYEMPVM
ncbi:triose-phosphate isomerase [Nocardioides insulae]|uniref:triose-phosphate isomerase n=1 Tax=Nocardioides insulae TaxID=394734 RepID=UPI000408413C|nr:triose-phosphate isomerase [Nocardioides insulae]